MLVHPIASISPTWGFAARGEQEEGSDLELCSHHALFQGNSMQTQVARKR